jgi:hypothetical protein
MPLKSLVTTESLDQESTNSHSQATSGGRLGIGIDVGL